MLVSLIYMDEKQRLLEQAEHSRRIADRINEPSTSEALRKLADESERKAEAIAQQEEKSPEADMAPDIAQESALNILRDFEEARVKLVGKGAILSDGKAGTIDNVYLDELHGLRISIDGHEGEWPVSTVKLAEHS
jgi:hypothetical protein